MFQRNIELFHDDWLIPVPNEIKMKGFLVRLGAWSKSAEVKRERMHDVET